MQFDVVIVGGGPAGLASAIRLKQCARDAGREISVCLLDKGSEIGAHILSGAIIDPRALDELLPDWRTRGAPLHTRVTQDSLLLLTPQHAWQLPRALLPPNLRHEGEYLGSLGELCRWLAREAEAMGVEIYPGFAAASLLSDDEGRICGVLSGEFGRLRTGEPGPRFQPGMALQARYTLIAEGTRGHLGRELETRFALRAGRPPQSYSLGLKELWRVPAAQHQPGLALHGAGWPLGNTASGGSFCYHYGDGLVAIGLVAGLEFRNPYFSPFQSFQQLKTHPRLRAMLAGGERLAYGARTLSTGGLPALPRLVFPGGALIGDVAGFLDAARNQGIHTVMKSGMLAAEAAAAALAGPAQPLLTAYPQAFARSWLHAELRRARHFKPALKRGLLTGSLLAGLDQWLGGRLPLVTRNPADHDGLQTAATSHPISYPPADGLLSFDLASSLQLANVAHAEDQPCHLQIAEPAAQFALSQQHASPETRYCPAGVYEPLPGPAGERLQINASNCLHCKACDIKDPGQHIIWTPPQGGEGPYYAQM